MGRTFRNDSALAPASKRELERRLALKRRRERQRRKGRRAAADVRSRHARRINPGR